jgi:hypothetical protein
MLEAATQPSLRHGLGELWFLLDQAGAVAGSVEPTLENLNQEDGHNRARQLAGAALTLLKLAKAKLEELEPLARDMQ